MDNIDSRKRKLRFRYFVVITLMGSIVTPISTFIKPELGVLVGLIASYVEYVMIFQNNAKIDTPILYVTFTAVVMTLINFIVLSFTCSIGAGMICKRNLALVSIYPGGLILIAGLLIVISALYRRK